MLKITIRMALAAIVFAGTHPAPAAAGQIAQHRTWDSPRALVSVSSLNVRAEPSRNAAIVTRLPRAWPVAILNDEGPPLTVEGQPDHWTYVATFRCTDEPCEHFEAGWVANTYLAFDDRFDLLDGGPSGTVVGYDSRSVFAYDVSANGAFTRWRLPCLAGACDITPEITPVCEYSGEMPLGGVCVLTGSLYRHRNLVRGKSWHGDWLDRQDVSLFLNAAGDLCTFGSGGANDTGRCASAVPGASSDQDPAGAITEMAADRRQRLAFTAVGALNLRAAPSHTGTIMGRLSRASIVERIGDDGLAVIVNGRRDRWVRVAVINCSSHERCVNDATGWVMDSFLAYEDRLTPVTDWPRPGSSGNHANGFEIAADGTFRRWEACGSGYVGLEICSHTGQLHRYRDLFVLKGNGGTVHSAYMADAGNLCLISSGIRLYGDRRCDS